MTYTVYVLHSDKFDRLYIGQTSDLTQRLLSHNEKGRKGYTSRFRPWRLIHTETFDSRTAAIQREIELKSGQGRLWIKKNILKVGSYPPEADAGSSSA